MATMIILLIPVFAVVYFINLASIKFAYSLLKFDPTIQRNDALFAFVILVFQVIYYIVFMSVVMLRPGMVEYAWPAVVLLPVILVLLWLLAIPFLIVTSNRNKYINRRQLKTTGVLFIIILAMNFSILYLAWDDGRITLRGRVVDSQNRPVQRAEINRAENYASQRADEDGYFVIKHRDRLGILRLTGITLPASVYGNALKFDRNLTITKEEADKTSRWKPYIFRISYDTLPLMLFHSGILSSLRHNFYLPVTNEILSISRDEQNRLKRKPGKPTEGLAISAALQDEKILVRLSVMKGGIAKSVSTSEHTYPYDGFADHVYIELPVMYSKTSTGTPTNHLPVQKHIYYYYDCHKHQYGMLDFEIRGNIRDISIQLDWTTYDNKILGNKRC